MSELLDVIDLFEWSAPDALTIINGDFNECDIKNSRAYLYQHIDCPTRGAATVDLLNTTFKDIYISFLLTNLGKADHNHIDPVPQYRPIDKREV